MSKQTCLLLIFVICFRIQFVYTQEETAVRSIIRAGDVKKLVKADEYKSEADKIVEEANRLNMEALSLQGNPELDEKSITKKAAQLEEQAQAKQVQASASYEKSNEIKFALYKQYIDEFWKLNEGKESDYLNAKLLEEQASDNYYQAISYRVDAKKMDAGYARIEKLSEALNLENQAIQKQVTALATYHNIGGALTQQPDQIPDQQAQSTFEPTAAETIADTLTMSVTEPIQEPVQLAANENTISDNVTVNQSIIDAYNRYIATGQFTDTSLATGEMTGVSSFDSDRILKLWYEYVYGKDALAGEDIASAQEEPVSENQDVAGTPDEQKKKDTAKPENEKDAEIGIVTDENKGVLIPSDENVIYRVQIAANRSQLSQRALSKMYYGNKTVEMINENGWYKYSVGDFTSYDEASQFRKSSGVDNAFVVAYRKGTRFVADKIENVEESQAIFTPAAIGNLPSGLIFRIQVAASRVPLTISQLKIIYPGNYPVEMISEEGWYKYQFMGVRLYSDALQIIRNVVTNGAFIVAYEDGNKINLAEAVKKNKSLEQLVKSNGRKGNIQEIEFHLQLAASRVAMQPSELIALYANTESVSIIYEDGWYKYHLKAGNSSEVAEQLKSSSGIPKSFIVSYKRGAKINLFEAIQELK